MILGRDSTAPPPPLSAENSDGVIPRRKPASWVTGSRGQGLKGRRFIIFLTAGRSQGCVTYKTSVVETRQKQAEGGSDRERHGIMLFVEHVMPREQQNAEENH